MLNAILQGIDLLDGLLRYPRRKHSLQKILTALLYVKPDACPDISFHSPRPPMLTDATLEITKRVSCALDRASVSLPFEKSFLIRPFFSNGTHKSVILSRNKAEEPHTPIFSALSHQRLLRRLSRPRGYDGGLRHSTEAGNNWPNSRPRCPPLL